MLYYYQILELNVYLIVSSLNLYSLQPYEDMEYVECVGQKEMKPQLVGALPPGALDWRPQRLDVMKLGSYYARLSKDRLTGKSSVCFECNWKPLN